MEADPDILRLGPEAILYAILDRVVDDYIPVVQGLETDIDEIETEVFSGNGNATRRTYELAREVIEFQRATKPLVGILNSLMNGADKHEIGDELQEYLRDVHDHAVHIQEQVAGFRELLQNVLDVNLAIVALQQNEELKAMTQASMDQNDEVKRISAWAAIAFAPTLIGTIYGMNFDSMPELHWRLGYPFSLFLMALVSYVMYAVFKRRGWLS
jgi:magnesium transporter